MIKRITLLLILLCYSQIASANFWSAAGKCVSDPCNCGDNDSKVYENWDGERLDKGKRNKRCPPWHKGDGRQDNTCLIKDNYPAANISYYENLCGEETPESNYFTPKIRVRGQQCNAFKCWTTSNTLDWDGMCVTLSSGYGFPLHRMCARIALPADDVNDLPADPGYTAGEHLNFEGATKPDDPIYSATGEALILEPPKLCLYKDPSFFSAVGGYDVMDLDPNKQPYHKTAKVHPVIQILKFFVSAQVAAQQTPFQLFEALIKSIESDTGGQTTVGEIMTDALSFIIKIHDWIGDQMFNFLNEVGQINRVVDDTIYGCVDIPSGPYPPPFCETVAPFSQAIIVQKICPKDSSGNFVASTTNNPCVVSTLTNNFVNNAARVGFETLVPLCKNGEDPMTTDTCVTIKNLDAFSSASITHAATAYRDLIFHCDNAPSGAPCIKTMLPHTCTVTANGCQDGFRIVYAKNLADTLIPQDYFYEDIPDCSGSEAVCQEIWGVNLGEFVDTALTFPAVQDPADIAPLSHNFDLVDKNGTSVAFTASIVRASSFNSTFSFTQDPKQLCVFDDNEVVGCVDRIPPSAIKIYDCNTSFAGISCTSSYFSPEFIASYSEGGSSTSALVEPLTVYNADTGNLNTSINLAGNSFESFVTDDSFIAKPFSGANSPNPSSIFGTYQDGEKPIDGDTVNDKAVYLTGLEYINDEYHLGGKYECLAQVNIGNCPDDVTYCVLAKLLEADTVSCSDLITKATEYGNLSVCPSDTSGCTVADSIDKTSGGSMNILDCGTNGMCYDNGGVELCKISQAPEDRQYPDAALGNTLTADQYYDPSSTTPGSYPSGNYSVNYDTDKYGIRNKTSLELGLCVAIPQGICAEQTDYSEDNGYAYWPATNVGEQATGTCPSGWQQADPLTPLKRYCIPNSDTKTFVFEPLYRTDSHGNKTYTNVKCIQTIIP